MALTAKSRRPRSSRSDAAARDDRHVHGVRDGPRQLELVAVLGAVAVHAGEKDLAGAAPDALARPLDGVAAHRAPPALHEDAVAIALAPRIDREHHALGA